MKSRAVVLAILMLAACRSGTLDMNSGSSCASTAITCGDITCGPFELCDTSGASAVCRCGTIAFTTTANATGCACSGTDSAHPGCGDVTSPNSSEAQCFSSNDLAVSSFDIGVGDQANGDLTSESRPCANAGSSIICGGSALCPFGAWCDTSTPSSPVCRCGDAPVPASTEPNCTCSGMADPDHPGCLLGSPTNC